MSTPESDDKMNWTRYWSSLTESEKDKLRCIGMRFVGMIDGLDDDGSPLLLETVTELVSWQQLENAVLKAHSEWLSRTKAKFERNGWPWTTDELARRSSPLWEHE